MVKQHFVVVKSSCSVLKTQLLMVKSQFWVVKSPNCWWIKSNNINKIPMFDAEITMI